MRVAIYCRISTDEDLQRFSLAAQEDELRRLAERRGWAVAAVYRDRMSGASADRPGLAKLRDDMAAGKFEAVLVVDQDRLSRLDPVDWELLKREFREAGVRVITPAQEIDFGDEDAELVSDVFNVFARHQRRKLKKAMLRGMAESAARGNWPSSQPPDGYRIEVVRGRRTLAPDPERAPVIRRIFELYASGLGVHRIGRALEAEGLLPPGGGSWRPANLVRILRNPAYLGVLEAEIGGRKVRVENAWEPLVDPSLAALCRGILEERSRGHRFHRAAQESTLANGLLVCGECGLPLHVRASHTVKAGRRYSYYYYAHRQAERGKRIGCRCRHRGDVLDRRILEALKRLGESPEAARALIFARSSDAERAELEAALRRIEREAEALRARRKRLARLYLDGDVDREFYLEQRRALEAALARCGREAEAARGRLEVLAGERVDLDLVVEYFAALRRLDAEMSFRELRAVVGAVFPEIRVDAKGAMVITARVPLFRGRGGIQSHSLRRRPDEKGTEIVAPGAQCGLVPSCTTRPDEKGTEISTLNSSR